jgi:hypothetical protein
VIPSTRSPWLTAYPRSRIRRISSRIAFFPVIVFPVNFRSR